jgi:hypothetical protein
MFVYHIGYTNGKVLYQDPTVTLEEDDDDKTPPDDKDDDLDDVKNKDDDEEDKDDDEDKDGEDKDKKDDDDNEGTARVEFSAIKEKYPNFFKDFPDLRHAFFREQQFTEIFPTVEEAQKAAQDQVQYEEITSAVISGDAEKFLEELGGESKDGLAKFVENFIPALRNADKDLYFDVATPIVRNHVREVFAAGIRNKDANVVNAAKIVHKLLFGGNYDDIENDTPLPDRRTTRRDKDKDDDEDKKELSQRQNQKYHTLYQDVTNLVYSTLEKELEKGLEDLKDRPGLKKAVIKEAKERILAEMEKDQNYLTRINSLWQREQRNGFNGSLKPSFQTTFMGKARTILTKMRIEARKEILGKEDKGSKQREPNRPGSGREASRGSKPITKDEAKGKTSLEIFNS